MKTYALLSIFIVLSFFPSRLLAQYNEGKIQNLDTIYANDTKNVALFFPNPIRQGITGSDNFIFTFNREKEQHLGLLQAKPGKDSNLLVINSNGAIFSYIVKYRPKLTKVNYFISKTSSIGNETGFTDKKLVKGSVSKTTDPKYKYYARFSSYLLHKKQYHTLRRQRKNGIVLSLENIIFNGEELYFVLQVKNKSTLDFDLNFLSISVETRQKGKKKSAQRLIKTPIYKYYMPSKIEEGATKRFVYVLPKFSISNERRVILELNEKDGERNVKLKLSHRYINNPN